MSDIEIPCKLRVKEDRSKVISELFGTSLNYSIKLDEDIELRLEKRIAESAAEAIIWFVVVVAASTAISKTLEPLYAKVAKHLKEKIGPMNNPRLSIADNDVTINEDELKKIIREALEKLRKQQD